MKSLAEVIASHDVVVCTGSGGVGKTTTAAALGLLGAAQGRRTVVLTIDPARRLANALGMRELGNSPTPVDLDDGGALEAMMLDQKGAWDALVERYAPSAEVRDQIYGNAFYRHLSESFAGSQEYMAIEQLAELRASKRYDLIIVDTPPTHHALDFLAAPRRLADFLDRRVVRWFVKPYLSAGWSGLQIVNRAAGNLLHRLEEATGLAALAEISEFFAAMEGLFDGFDARVKRVDQLLRSRHTAFVLVATAEEQVLAEAEFFAEKIKEHSIVLRAVLFNRVGRDLGLGFGKEERQHLDALVGRTVKGATGRALVDNLLAYETQARGDQLRLEAFRAQLPARMPVSTIPNFDRDVHDIADLRRMLPYFDSSTGS
jgi:anion-transporting  ArsA/GET3 family ATPase